MILRPVLLKRSPSPEERENYLEICQQHWRRDIDQRLHDSTTAFRLNTIFRKSVVESLPLELSVIQSRAS